MTGHSLARPPTRPFARRTVQFEYVGRTRLTVLGPVTGVQYRFQGCGARVNVDARDARSLEGVPRLRRLAPTRQRFDGTG